MAVRQNTDGENEIQVQSIVAEQSLSAADSFEVDLQVATANRYPRSIDKFKSRSLEMATSDHEIAESCFYVLERGKKKIQGPSVRLAEIALCNWGNVRSKSEIVGQDKRFVTARGTCWDLQQNVAVSLEVRRRITNSDGVTYNDDMISQTSNAASSIALRNAIFRVIPQALILPIYHKAISVAVGDSQTLNDRRQKMLDRFKSNFGISPEKIFDKLNVIGIEDITLEHLKDMIGTWSALRNNETTLDDEFPPEERVSVSVAADVGTKKTSAEELADKIKGMRPEKSANKVESESTEQPKTTTPGVVGNPSTENIPPEGDRQVRRRTPKTNPSNGVEAKKEPEKTESNDSEIPFDPDLGKSPAKSQEKQSGESSSDSAVSGNDMMTQCHEFLLSQSVKCAQADPEKQIRVYDLPNGKHLMVGLSLPAVYRDGWFYVDATEADALEQVVNILTQAGKAR